MAKIFRILEIINRLIVPIGLGAMLIMVVAVVINVIGRATVRAPLYGSVEIVELTSVILVSFIAAYTQLKKENVIVSILVDRMSPKLRAGFDSVTSVLGLAAVVVLLYTGAIYTVETYGYGEITHVFQISTIPFRIMWLIGLTVMALVMVAQIIQNIARAVSK